MRSHLIVVVAAAVGCGETPSGPFAALPIDGRFEDHGLDDVVHVARDRFGIAHVHATTPGDLGFAQGYVMAHDRLPQMELLRRYASGTLAEIYGGDTATILSDVTMRFHRMRKFAEDTWNELQLSANDAELVGHLTRFADGVNAYVDDAIAGRWPVDPTATDAGLFPLFAPARFAPWTPIDSIVIMRFFTFAQSWTVAEELALDELDVRVRSTFTPELARDLLAITPIEPQQPGAAPQPATPSRPAVPPELFASARAFFEHAVDTDNSRVLLPQAFMRPHLGSSAFVVGVNYTGEQLETAKSILAADMHGMLSNPSLFYPMHQILEVAPGVVERDVLGLLLPGCPVAVAGTNGSVGWAPTLGTHDVNDVYLETLVANGTASMHDGIEEPLASFTEEILVGDHGAITGSRVETFEFVPRHGPVIPNHPPGAALSIKYTGYVATREIAVLWELGRSLTASVESAQTILRDMRHGPHYMLVDFRGASAFTTYADVPDRPAAARTWSPDFPGGAAPFFVLDGTNPEHEWAERPLERDALPITFGFEGAIVVADGDYTNNTDDGNPLDGTYLGIAYGNGLRDARIAELIDTITIPLDANDLARIQHDTRSNMGAAIRIELLAILHTAPELAALSEADMQQIALARDVLDAWASLETPTASVAADSSSSATLLFNTWMALVVDAAIGNALDSVQYPTRLDDDRAARIVYRLLADRTALAAQPSGEPVLCPATCATLVLRAMVDAVNLLTAGGRTADDWRWGRAHALRMRGVFPDLSGALVLPRTEESPGFELPGDMFVVDRADPGWDDATDFRPKLGVAYRMQLVGSPFGNPLVLRLELPTGTVLDTRDPHYRDLLERGYLTRTPFVVPYLIADINDAGESRWELR